MCESNVSERSSGLVYNAKRVRFAAVLRVVAVLGAGRDEAIGPPDAEVGDGVCTDDRRARRQLGNCAWQAHSSWASVRSVRRAVLRGTEDVESSVVSSASHGRQVRGDVQGNSAGDDFDDPVSALAEPRMRRTPRDG